MQDRGIVPSVVEETIKNGEKFPADGNKTVHYDEKNNIQVITNQKGDVVTTSYGEPNQRRKSRGG